MKRWSAANYLQAGQGIFFAALALQCGLLFDRTLLTDGISYFGVHVETIVPYAIGFLTAAWCLWQASYALPKFAYMRVLRHVFRLMSVFLLGILATPYTFSSLTGLLHDCFSASLFLTQVLLAGWLAFWVTKRRTHHILYLAQLLSAISAGLALLNITQVMFYSQVICQLCFAILIVLEVASLERVSEMERTPVSADAL